MALMAFSIGSACAFFLWSLDAVTHARGNASWLLYGLPIAGGLVGWIYYRIGKEAEGGNNLIIDQIHEPGGGVPRRMAPLILLGTLVTHLFGGSAGREGTAVQMGGSIASAFARFWRMESKELRLLLMTGIAAGFGGVFGTPWAGAIFAVEVLMVGRLESKAFLPCLLSAFIGDWGCRVWGVGHLHYPMHFVWAGEGIWRFLPHDILLWFKVGVAGILLGWGSLFFSEILHLFQSGFKRVIAFPPFRPVVGGIAVIGMTWLVGTTDYLGLGVSSPDPHAVTILSFFQSAEIQEWSWLWKILFTAVTVGSGFKGGEVTPLFFIGAAMGNVISAWMGGPFDLFVAVGFVAIFAGAAKTPIACTVMGMELFGAEYGIYFATACFLAFWVSGHSGIYHSQRVPHAEGSKTWTEMREANLNWIQKMIRRIRDRK
jgi:H+/Cl- antiporter ClcA